MTTQHQIFSDLQQILQNFEGREYSQPLTSETRFFQDLQFASIDAVVLGETIERYYGQPIPFAEFLSESRQRHAQDITVAELASFLSRHLR